MKSFELINIELFLWLLIAGFFAVGVVLICELKTITGYLVGFLFIISSFWFFHIILKEALK